MSLQSSEQFTIAVAHNPALSAEVTEAASSQSLDEAAVTIARIGKREGYDFTPDEALQTRKALSDSDLDKVAGGGGDPYIQTAVGQAAGGLAGRAAPGVGGVIGAGVGAGVATAVGGGSASQSVASGAMAANQNLNDTRNAVQQFFETKW